MKFCIQDLMRYLAHLKHLGEHLRNLHAGGTYKNGASTGAHEFNLLDDCLIFLSLGAINTVVHVLTNNGTIGRNLNHIELVDVPELACLCDCSTRHTSQFVVHAEVVLQGYGSVSLCGSLHLNMLLCFDSLMQSVAPTTSFHDTASLFIYNLDFAILNDILVIEVEHCVSLQQLLDGVYAFALGCIVIEDAVLLLELFFVSLG